MNELHHHFENLIGQVGNTSRWFFKPKRQIACWHVQQLNELLHEIESTVNSIKLGNGEKSIFLNYSGSRFSGDFDPEPIRYELTDEHYECFEDTKHKWGMLTAYYSQLGKQHIEVFTDGDNCISNENISGIQYMIGESILSLGKRPPDEFPGVRITDEFKNWLISNGFSPDDSKLALGLGVLAQIFPEDNTHIGATWNEIDFKLHSMNDVYKLGFVDENNNVECQAVYDYTWNDYRNSIINSILDKEVSHTY
jgi:hypothetical protein